MTPVGKLESHELVSAIKELASELKKVPTRAEFEEHFPGAHYRMGKFGGYSVLLQAAGLSTYDARRAMKAGSDEGKQTKWKYSPARVDPNVLKNAVTLNLKHLFKKAQNPKTLKVVCMPDTHLKNADAAALECFVKYVTWAQPDVLMIMGDFLDAGGLSHWDSDSFEAKRIVPECLQGRAFLTRLKKLLHKTTTWIYLEGNHEDWINQFLVHGANPQLFDGLEELGMNVNLVKLLTLDELGFEFFKVNQIVRIGKAGFTHGLYTGDAHAKKHLSKVKGTIFYGHLHDGQSYEDTSMDGPVEAQSFRCLCDLNPKFLKGRLNNWSHGFGELEFFPDGSFTKVLRQIVDGKTTANGRVFDGNEK